MLNALLSALALMTATQDDGSGATPPEQPVLRLDAAESTSTVDEDDIVLRSASQYAGFHRTLGEIREREITSGAVLDQSMDEIAVYLARERLVRAWLAYSSLIAEQHPQFLDDVRDVADYYGRDAAVAALANDPAYAGAFRYADQASESVLLAIDEDAAEIEAIGEQFRLSAYDLQSERWANAVARDRQNRLAALRAADQIAAPLATDMFSTSFVSETDIRSASSMFAHDTPPPSLPANTPDLSLNADVPYEPDRVRVGRILSIAALRAIGSDNRYTEDSLQSLLADPLAQRCIEWARVNLSQCVAAAHFEYEDSFCIAQHALIEVSQCLEAAQNRRE
ncbi:hypothetical protein V0U79_11740 [Hyphobacterium sp. HN65]|uniref:Secreted protein n=1 Tax=Hyphobacterium lacteum TaxID=3116575 RepID=A0ABU7LTR9_9PROT|nr:hypothetical protein [Hyphobacterium sp. HN65]MEE2527041.1 hypothetical protein [Hyphobacterium sp. HN65]